MDWVQDNADRAALLSRVDQDLAEWRDVALEVSAKKGRDVAMGFWSLAFDLDTLILFLGSDNGPEAEVPPHARPRSEAAKARRGKVAFAWEPLPTGRG